MPNLSSQRLFKMLMKPQEVNHPGIRDSALPQVSLAKVTSLHDVKCMQAIVSQMPQLNQSVDYIRRPKLFPVLPQPIGCDQLIFIKSKFTWEVASPCNV